MKIVVAILCFLLMAKQAFSQVTETVTNNAEQQLENTAESNADQETEDDSFLQQLVQFLKDPVNLNTADEAGLAQLVILSPLQIRNLIMYRSLAGKMIDLYELQAIPGWDLATIQKIRPYITVSIQVPVTSTLRSRLRGGGRHLLVRASQVVERSKGYGVDTSTGSGFYPGSPQKIFFRYTYVYKDLMQYGILGEKDAGEQFFKGKQKQGFDFYSAHIFIRRAGIIRSLAIGDFTVNLGQGLTQWQSLAFKKSAEVIHVKRESAVLRPYHAAGEINFHRGIGITLAKNNWQFTAFVSYRNIDANFVSDTSQLQHDYVTSLQTSGYHRTKNEAGDKGIQRQLAFGGNARYRFKKLHLGINGIQYTFRLPIKKTPDPYNIYAWNGSSFGNYSVDYSYTRRNVHFFGEAAFSSNRGMAFINGLIISVASRADLALLYRNISGSYQSLYTSAFTENTFPTNEKGLYAGISVRPHDSWRVNAYADLFRFPWLRSRADAPTSGSGYLIQLQYKPDKQLEIYTRYQFSSKAVNADPGRHTLSPVVMQPRKNWRTQLNYKVNAVIMVRTRTEIVWFDKKGDAYEQGFLSYIDMLYKPLLNPFSGNLRLQYFETGGYNSRLYAYENDVLYHFSIPVFYDKGYRYYININYDINKKISCWARWAQTIYRGKTLIGSGLDEIKGNTRSEVRVQANYKF